ncbi:hypothetical protein [Rickettsiella endosymbiont of Aleochara curtula]|uniref:hypothetical protein n=1 Tax=Rickettsiella endosymbiont of Aleochara curtula TaxID=3077936 RepID=UPI00313CBFFF
MGQKKIPFAQVKDLHANQQVKFKDPNSNVPIDKNFVFLRKFKSFSEISDAEFKEFFKLLESKNENIQKEIYIKLLKACIANYNTHESGIQQALAAIENSVREQQPIPKCLFKFKDFIGVINSYRLFNYPNVFSTLREYYPETHDPEKQDYNVITSLIPCAINILVIVGVFPKSDNFHGINLAKPCYPLGSSSNKINFVKGIKNHADYYLLRRVSKIHKGDLGNRTFLAVKADGSKLLYLNPSRPAHGILASKIARLVSTKHFSSERLLNNGFGGSRELAGFISAAEPSIRDGRKRFVEVEKRVFPGTGIINEVQNYVGESDPNIENIGFSSKDFQYNYLIKIDFDLCFLHPTISKEAYAKNILLGRNGMYHDLPHVQQDKKYLQETLYARLKLSLLTTEIVFALAQKVYTETNLHEITQQYITRSKICLALFLEDEHAEAFLSKNPEILTQCYAEIAEHIEKHFEKTEPLLSSLKQQAYNVRVELSKKLALVKVDFSAPQLVDKPKFKISQTEIEALIKKASELNSRDFPEAGTSVQRLVENLQIHILFFEQGCITIDVFKERCNQQINIARPKLGKHRGWKKLLVDLAKLLGLQKITTSNSFFFTDSLKKVIQLEKQLNNFPQSNALQLTP